MTVTDLFKYVLSQKSIITSSLSVKGITLIYVFNSNSNIIPMISIVYEKWFRSESVCHHICIISSSLFYYIFNVYIAILYSNYYNIVLL